MKVLIIEDDVNLIGILRHFVEPLTEDIVVAHTMEQALQILSEAKDVTLVTLDLGLPDSGVEETIEKIKHIRALTPDSLVVVVTGNDYPGIKERALRGGADGFILKQDEHFTADGFLEFIGAICGPMLCKPQDYKRSADMLQSVVGRLTEIHNLNPTSR